MTAPGARFLNQNLAAGERPHPAPGDPLPEVVRPDAPEDLYDPLLSLVERLKWSFLGAPRGAFTIIST